MLIMIDNSGGVEMKLVVSAAICVGLLASPSAYSGELECEAVAQQNPFEIVDQLHGCTYEDLHEIYPDLDDIILQALMYRIVESMKVPG
tara:strand:+ start:3626 stop:3892 length:267 start_codon:yes stop_codon:yes gene_type:complete